MKHNDIRKTGWSSAGLKHFQKGGNRFASELCAKRKWCTVSDIKANPDKFWIFSFKKQYLMLGEIARRAVELKAAGEPLKSIAAALNVSVSTVQRYIKQDGRRA